MEENHDKNLKNQTVFTYKKMLLGIPDTLFVVTSLLAGFGCILLFKLTVWYIALPLASLFLLLLYRPLMVIHQHDHHAWQLWLATLWSAPSFSTQYTSSKKRHLLVVRSTEGLSLNDINRKQNEKTAHRLSRPAS